MIPDPAKRYRVMPRFFEVFLRLRLRRGDTVHTTDGLTAGALWAPPDQWKTRVSDVVAVAPAMVRVLGPRLLTSLRGLSMVEAVHPEAPPHWYLATLGTDAGHQGKGFGSAVIRPVLDKCDRDGVPAYLESSKEQNIPFYERHGFRVTGEVRFGKKGPLVWLMWRDPQPSSE